MNQGKKIRVLVAKVGLDGHDKGAILVSSRLRDAGMEVIYTGLRKTVDQVINTAIQEDVDVIGISLLSGAHMTICRKLITKMEEKGIKDKLLVVGGVIPEEDIPRLIDMGVSAVFTQDSTFDEMIDFVRKSVGVS